LAVNKSASSTYLALVLCPCNFLSLPPFSSPLSACRSYTLRPDEASARPAHLPLPGQQPPRLSLSFSHLRYLLRLACSPRCRLPLVLALLLTSASPLVLGGNARSRSSKRGILRQPPSTSNTGMISPSPCTSLSPSCSAEQRAPLPAPGRGAALEASDAAERESHLILGPPSRGHLPAHHPSCAARRDVAARAPGGPRPRPPTSPRALEALRGPLVRRGACSGLKLRSGSPSCAPGPQLSGPSVREDEDRLSLEAGASETGAPPQAPRPCREPASEPVGLPLFVLPRVPPLAERMFKVKGG